MTHQHALLILATNPRKPYKPGQHRRLQHIGPIHITTVTHLTLADITHQHARMLGHRGTAAHKRAWLDQHDHNWLTAELRGDQEQLDRYATRWAHRAAILVTYIPVDTPRFLAHPIPGRSGDYTPNRARSIDPDAEAVPPSTLDVERARRESQRQRESFQRDLEAERARRKALKRPYPKAA
jgi:hypothetical protein